jgi:hypothetical protein
MKMKTLIILFVILSTSFSFSQTRWYSDLYDYSIEIPNGYNKSKIVSSNVDFKANNGLNSIVIVVKSISTEYTNYTIWDMLGNLETFGADWELGAKEYMDNPKFLKYGKTNLSNLETFWYDYTTDNPKLYSKNYQIKKGNKLYTITLTCKFKDYNNNSSIWYRFKEQISL